MKMLRMIENAHFMIFFKNTFCSQNYIMIFVNRKQPTGERKKLPASLNNQIGGVIL